MLLQDPVRMLEALAVLVVVTVESSMLTEYAFEFNCATQPVINCVMNCSDDNI